MPARNDLIRDAIRGRAVTVIAEDAGAPARPDVPPAWMVADNGSPLWLPREQWPDGLVIFPMPGAQIRLEMRKLRDTLQAANQTTLAERASALLEFGGRHADADVVAVHARLGVRADNTVILVADPAEKVSLIVRKVAGDTPLRLAFSKLFRGGAPGPLTRLTVSAWRSEKPGRPID